MVPDIAEPEFVNVEYCVVDAVDAVATVVTGPDVDVGRADDDGAAAETE